MKERCWTNCRSLWTVVIHFCYFLFQLFFSRWKCRNTHKQTHKHTTPIFIINIHSFIRLLYDLPQWNKRILKILIVQLETRIHATNVQCSSLDCAFDHSLPKSYAIVHSSQHEYYTWASSSFFLNMCLLILSFAAASAIHT